MMFLFRNFVLPAFLLMATEATPIRDLSKDSLSYSQCEWSGLDIDDDLNGVMVLYRGNKLAEYRAEDTEFYREGTTQHAQYSVTKTWVSVLVGVSQSFTVVASNILFVVI